MVSPSRVIIFSPLGYWECSNLLWSGTVVVCFVHLVVRVGSTVLGAKDQEALAEQEQPCRISHRSSESPYAALSGHQEMVSIFTIAPFGLCMDTDRKKQGVGSAWANTFCDSPRHCGHQFGIHANLDVFCGLGFRCRGNAADESCLCHLWLCNAGGDFQRADLRM